MRKPDQLFPYRCRLNEESFVEYPAEYIDAYTDSGVNAVPKMLV
jgi:hypothetical protein